MKKRTLSLEEIAKILCHSTETIKRYAKRGELPKIEGDDESLAFSEEEIAEKFGLENLDEPFIDIKKASEITGLKKDSIYHHVLKSKNHLPHYKLKSVFGKKGAVKFLFRESELKEWIRPKILICSSGYYNRKYKEDLLKEMINSALFVNKKLEFLNNREKNILENFPLDEKNLSEIGIGKWYARRIFNRSYHKIKQKFQSLPQLIEENKKYLERIRMLEEKVKMLGGGKNMSYSEIKMENNILRAYATPLENADLSVRAYNCLQAAEAKTLGDVVVNYSEKDLLRFRNTGRKTVDKIKSVLEKYGLRLKED